MIQRLREALWFCAGADIPLARTLTLGQHSLTSVGATVLATAILAFLSGSYALYFVFHSQLLAVLFGLFWAGVIFNLDRFLVASIRKQGSLEDVATAVPRVALALLIAIVVVVPLELRLFESEIDAKLPEYALEQQKTYASVLERAPLQQQIQSVGARIQEIQSEIVQLETQRNERVRNDDGARLGRSIDSLEARMEDLEARHRTAVSKGAEVRRQATEEDEGLRESRAPGQGRNYRALKARESEQEAIAAQLAQELTSLRRERSEAAARLDEILGKARIAGLLDELKKQERTREGLEQEKRTLVSSWERNVESTTPSLLARLTLSRTLAEENATVDWSVTVLRLLVILLELSPILVKLLSPRGSYDVLRHAAETEEILSAQLRQRKAEAEYESAARSIRAEDVPGL